MAWSDRPQRAPIQFDAYLFTEDDTIEGRVRNLSMGGCFVATDACPPVGTELDCMLRVRDGEPLFRTRVTVVWVRDQADGDLPAGMGLRFFVLTPEVADVLTDLVQDYVGGLFGPHEVQTVAELEAFFAVAANEVLA